jgi:Zn-dependent peptidase ImmA (M78 family)
MKKMNLETADFLAAKMRSEYLRISSNEPVNMKTSLRQLNIMTVYRPLSDNLFGMSLATSDKQHRFMLVNSNSTRGRQHFTIAHELYHLYFDVNPKPHFCSRDNYTDPAERSANMFASALLMPKEGLLQQLSVDEISSKKVEIDTLLRLEHLYGTSHQTLLVRLKELRIITSSYFEKMQNISVTWESSMRGYDLDLYTKGNEGLVIGDFGSKARKLFDEDRISEGHYLELLNLIGYGKSGNCSGC